MSSLRFAFAIAPLTLLFTAYAHAGEGNGTDRGGGDLVAAEVQQLKRDALRRLQTLAKTPTATGIRVEIFAVEAKEMSTPEALIEARPSRIPGIPLWLVNRDLWRSGKFSREKAEETIAALLLENTEIPAGQKVDLRKSYAQLLGELREWGPYRSAALALYFQILQLPDTLRFDDDSEVEAGLIAYQTRKPKHGCDRPAPSARCLEAKQLEAAVRAKLIQRNTATLNRMRDAYSRVSQSRTALVAASARTIAPSTGDWRPAELARLDRVVEDLSRFTTQVEHEFAILPDAPIEDAFLDRTRAWITTVGSWNEFRRASLDPFYSELDHQLNPPGQK